jgi:hypothetical protein
MRLVLMDTRVLDKNGRSKESHLRLAVDGSAIQEAPLKQIQDKRTDHRHTLELDTEVHFRENSLNGMFRCRTSNIGLQGAFFPAQNLPITDNTEINLVFHARTRSRPKFYRLSAKLVRLQDNGAALVFCPDDEEQGRDFRRFLLKAKIAARK